MTMVIAATRWRRHQTIAKHSRRDSGRSDADPAPQQGPAGHQDHRRPGARLRKGESAMEEDLEKYRPLFIGGEWVDPARGETDDDINPATGKTIAKVAVARSEERRVGKECRSPGEPYH